MMLKHVIIVSTVIIVSSWGIPKIYKHVKDNDINQSSHEIELRVIRSHIINKDNNILKEIKIENSSDDDDEFLSAEEEET